MNISDEAVEAAHKAWREQASAVGSIFEYNLRAALEAAAPHMLAEANSEVEKLRAHILDIDAHATPFGDIPDDPGYVGSYLVSAGALHRALGKIGHTAPSCEAEAKLAEVWDQAASSIIDEHGNQIKPTNVTNPYRSQA